MKNDLGMKNDSGLGLKNDSGLKVDFNINYQQQKTNILV